MIGVYGDAVIVFLAQSPMHQEDLATTIKYVKNVGNQNVNHISTEHIMNIFAQVNIILNGRIL
jgi:hypothetical protein